MKDRVIIRRHNGASDGIHKSKHLEPSSCSFILIFSLSIVMMKQIDSLDLVLSRPKESSITQVKSIEMFAHF